MSRVQLALNVDNLDEAITFYPKLFNTHPAKVKPGYANFAVTEPPPETGPAGEPRQGRHNQPPRGGSGIQRDGARRDRPSDHGGLVHRRGDRHHVLLRHSGQGHGVTGPAGEKWEVYTVLADSDSFGTSPAHLDDDAEAAGVLWRQSTHQRTDPDRVVLLLLTRPFTDRSFAH